MDASLVYPAPLFVRNTFLDCFEDRPPSLEEFLKERLVKSCPASGVSEAGVAQQAAESLAARCPEVPQTHNLSVLCVTRQSIMAANEGDATSECSTTDTTRAAGGRALGSTGSPSRLRAVSGDVMVLELQNTIGCAPAAKPAAIPAPSVAPGPLPCRPAETPGAGAGAAAELPSIGSAGHFSGRCKPCAFANTKGCSMGKDCQFCHLCESGEKKRRQKEKRAFFGTMRRLQKSAGDAWPNIVAWR